MLRLVDEIKSLSTNNMAIQKLSELKVLLQGHRNNNTHMNTMYVGGFEESDYNRLGANRQTDSRKTQEPEGTYASLNSGSKLKRQSGFRRRPVKENKLVTGHTKQVQTENEYDSLKTQATRPEDLTKKLRQGQADFHYLSKANKEAVKEQLVKNAIAKEQNKSSTYA